MNRFELSGDHFNPLTLAWPLDIGARSLHWKERNLRVLTTEGGSVPKRHLAMSRNQFSKHRNFVVTGKIEIEIL